MGYAIVAYRDAAEAQEAIEFWNGKELAPGFKVRLQPGVLRRPRPIVEFLPLNCDPDVRQQLAPLAPSDIRLRLEYYLNNGHSLENLRAYVESIVEEEIGGVTTTSVKCFANSVPTDTAEKDNPASATTDEERSGNSGIASGTKGDEAVVHSCSVSALDAVPPAKQRTALVRHYEKFP